MIFRFHIKNQYSIVLLLIIVSVCLGTIFGGSFQPMRILLFLFFIIYFSQIIKNKIDFRKDIPVLLGLLLFFFWIVYGSISLLWSPDPMNGLTAGIMAMSVGYIALPLFVFLFQKADDPLITVRKGWLICFLLTAILGIYEIITNRHFDSAEEIRILGGVGITVPFASATYGNLNNYETVISFITPYLLWGVLEGKDAISKIIYMGAFLLGLLFTIINGSRIGLFVIIFQLFCFSFMLLRRLKKKYIIGGCVLLVIVIMILPMDNLLITMKYRLPSISSVSNAVNEGRGTMLICGWEMFMHSYGFGIGAGGFEKAVIYQPSFEGDVINPHNLTVEIFAQYGILILVFYYLWLFSIFYFAFKNKQITSGARMAVCISVITLPFIGMMSSHSLGYTYYWIFLSCMTAISVYKYQLK